MKTTLESPYAIFRQAKAKAAEQGKPLRQFVSEAVAEKLKSGTAGQYEARARLAGRLRRLRRETARIDALIEGECDPVQ